MELRQLRYFVTLAEELHFGRAAAREHIVQSALSQQLKRLERELGQCLVERSTHHVRLTPAGHTLLGEARDILERVDRAVAATRAVRQEPVLRAGAGHAGYGSMACILGRVRQLAPRTTIHEAEFGTPELLSRLAGGRLDAALGHVVAVPAGLSTEVVRRERVGVLLPAGHALTQCADVPISALADEILLRLDDAYAPEFNRFTAGLFDAADRRPAVSGGTVQSLRAVVDQVFHGQCVAIVPGSCPAHNGVEWRPLSEPSADYPWSVLWRTGDRSEVVRTFLAAARSLSRDRAWQDVPTAAAERHAHRLW